MAWSRHDEVNCFSVRSVFCCLEFCETFFFFKEKKRSKILFLICKKEYFRKALKEKKADLTNVTLHLFESVSPSLSCMFRQS